MSNQRVNKRPARVADEPVAVAAGEDSHEQANVRNGGKRTFRELPQRLRRDSSARLWMRMFFTRIKEAIVLARASQLAKHGDVARAWMTSDLAAKIGCHPKWFTRWPGSTMRYLTF